MKSADGDKKCARAARNMNRTAGLALRQPADMAIPNRGSPKAWAGSNSGQPFHKRQPPKRRPALLPPASQDIDKKHDFMLDETLASLGPDPQKDVRTIDLIH
jgi:hypothetical protein